MHCHVLHSRAFFRHIFVMRNIAKPVGFTVGFYFFTSVKFFLNLLCEYLQIIFCWTISIRALRSDTSEFPWCERWWPTTQLNCPRWANCDPDKFGFFIHFLFVSFRQFVSFCFLHVVLLSFCFVCVLFVSFCFVLFCVLCCCCCCCVRACVCFVCFILFCQ